MEQVSMTLPGLIVYFSIIALSHIAFGVFSSKHRFNNIITWVVYILFGVFFVTFGTLVDMKFGLLFLIIFTVYVSLYLILSSGKILKNLFLITSYLTFIIIFFGITFAFMFIPGPGYIAIRWVLIVITQCGLQCLLYLFLIPKFKKAEKNISKGWGLLLTGDILFLIVIFMQIFWPFNLDKNNIWTIVLFLLCSLVYFFIFAIVFNSFATTLSYYKEKEKSARLQVLAHKDGLTSLFNKYYFDVHASELVKKYEVNQINRTCVIVMDINKFKEINDRFGHVKGDEVLKQVGFSILNVFDDDRFKCFRIGGDEFAVVSIDVDEDIIINKIDLLKSDLNLMQVSISIGYSFVDYKNIDAITTALKNADKLMYQEKFR